LVALSLGKVRDDPLGQPLYSDPNSFFIAGEEREVHLLLSATVGLVRGAGHMSHSCMDSFPECLQALASQPHPL